MIPAPDLADLEVLVLGSGAPVTVVAHGLGGSTAETRPLVGGVQGTRVLYAARGHGRSPLRDGPVTYDLLGRELGHVADTYAATRAFGVSLGAGSILALLAEQPDRFARAVLFLPGALDRPRTDEAAGRVLRLADALEAGDRGRVAALVAAELPADLPGTAPYVRARTAFLLASPQLPQVLRAVPRGVPVADRTRLAGVTAEVLVLACEGDPLHPAQVARELVGVLPRARLVVFDRPGVVWRERRRLRELVTGFLDGR